MTLDRLLRRKRLTVLGLNSGTSADGLDFAVVAIQAGKGRRDFRFVSGGKKKYPPSLRRDILRLADSTVADIDELVYLDNLLGEFMGRQAGAFMAKLPSNMSIDLIASHGQTVRHLPHKVKLAGTGISGTLQLGSAEFIAAATMRPVISNFRQADVAIGNEGAPITVAAMGELFGSKTEPRLIVNVGGMSNYFYFPAGRDSSKVRAADCGPGNSLCDSLSWKLHRERFDRNGRRARHGQVSRKIVRRIMTGGFFTGKLASTGRELFGSAMADRIIKLGRKAHLSGDDMLATAAEITVTAVDRKLRPLLRSDKSLSKLYLTGGGRNNIFFVDGLKRRLPGIDVLSIDELGIDGDYVEAAAYAVMGEACLRSRPLVTVFVGQRKQRCRPVLGRITQPPARVLK